MIWNEERVEEIKGLLKLGMSASQIAKRLGGVSRNAVIGVVYRKGLTFATRPKSGDHAVRERVARMTRPRRPAPQPRPVNRPPQEPRAFRPKVVALAEPTALLIPLMSLRIQHCRWPVIGEGADTAFCGHPKADGSAYCAHHKARSENAQPAASAKKLVRDLRRYCA